MPQGELFFPKLLENTFEVFFDTGAGFIAFDEHIGEQIRNKIADILNVSDANEYFPCSMKSYLLILEFYLTASQVQLCPDDYALYVGGNECKVAFNTLAESTTVILGMPFFVKYYTAFHLGDNPETPFKGWYFRFAEKKYCDGQVYYPCVSYKT